MSVRCKVGKKTLSCLFLSFLSCVEFRHCQLLIDNLIWLNVSGCWSSIDSATSARSESYPPLKCNLAQALLSVYRRSTRPLPEAMKISRKSTYKPEVPWYKTQWINTTTSSRRGRDRQNAKIGETYPIQPASSHHSNRNTVDTSEPQRYSKIFKISRSLRGYDVNTVSTTFTNATCPCNFSKTYACQPSQDSFPVAQRSSDRHDNCCSVS
jgi:hypothetical protein